MNCWSVYAGVESGADAWGDNAINKATSEFMGR